jgi:hypothetical protein
MGRKDPRIDAYIAKSPDFAKPVLKHIRKLVHKADPKVEETVKWGMPAFMHDGIVCGMAAFKQHCAMFFWKGALIVDKKGRRVDAAMGNFGKIRGIKDLPSDSKLVANVRKAVKLNVDKVKVPGKLKARKAVPLRVPADLNEYVDWIIGAKQPATRDKRLVTAIEWLSAGKNLNWRYEKRT